MLMMDAHERQLDKVERHNETVYVKLSKQELSGGVEASDGVES